MQSTTAATSSAAIDSLLDRKITLATEGFTTKFCELTLKDRKKLSKENALVVAEYIIAMKREINPRLVMNINPVRSLLVTLEKISLIHIQQF
jgi:hypothetical protein